MTSARRTTSTKLRQSSTLVVSDVLTLIAKLYRLAFIRWPVQRKDVYVSQSELVNIRRRLQ